MKEANGRNQVGDGDMFCSNSLFSHLLWEKCEKFSTLGFKRSDWPTLSFPISRPSVKHVT